MNSASHVSEDLKLVRPKKSVLSFSRAWEVGLLIYPFSLSFSYDDLRRHVREL